MKPRLLALALVLVTASCKKDPAKQAATNTPGSAAPVTPTGTLQIFVDDQPVGTLALDQAKLWPRLDTLVPVAARRLGTWQSIKLTSGPKRVQLEQPSAQNPELVPALFPGESGGISFGMFDPVELAKHGKPSLREDAVTAVHIVLAKGTGRGENEHHGEGGGGDPAALTLTVRTSKGAQVIEGATLLALPREAAPGEGDSKGWKLATVLAQVGVTRYERLVLTDTKDMSVTLEKQDLDPATSVPFIKLNRQGNLRFRVFRKQGDTWQPGSDLRGLATIEVLK